MGNATRLLLAALAVLVMAAPPARAHPDGAPAPAAAGTAADATVWVSRGGGQYHRRDCPRLRFEQALPLGEAVARYRPCPVCIGKPGLAAPATASVPAPAAPVAAPPPPPAPPVVRLPPLDSRPEPAPGNSPAAAVPPARRGSRGHNALIGALIGAGGGFGFGFLAGTLDDDGWFSPSELGAAFAVIGGGIGALVGVTLPPGPRVEARADAALEAGRVAVRRAAMAHRPTTAAQP